ncbi:hypothetical protein WJX82_010789 [Trebouxia sp. C0006]
MVKQTESSTRQLQAYSKTTWRSALFALTALAILSNVCVAAFAATPAESSAAITTRAGTICEAHTLALTQSAGLVLLKQTKKVLEEERKGQFATDLHAAVISQDLGALKQLNHKGADLSAKNQRGQCVLHVASGYGYPQMVKALLQFNAHADCRDEDGQTPLHMAASGRLDGDLEGRLACIALLLSYKANMELPDKVGKAPLHVAAETGNLESLIRLLDAGAHRAPRDRNGMRPVDLASMAGYNHIVDYLTSIDTAAQVGKLQQYSKYL